MALSLLFAQTLKPEVAETGHGWIYFINLGVWYGVVCMCVCECMCNSVYNRMSVCLFSKSEQHFNNQKSKTKIFLSVKISKTTKKFLSVKI